jgi:poly(ADP-ribose) glycohydrolase ARH3
MTQDQYAGCLLGLALGDALGAPHEGGLLERLVWRLIGKTKAGEARWTDDTQMALDVAESLIEAGGLDPDALAKRFAHSYRWSRGYGPSTTKVLKRIRRGEDWRRASTAIYRNGSFGNGAAMRAPVTGLFFASRPLDELIEAAKLSARITHVHPIGVEGAVLIAAAITTALHTSSPTEILAAVQSVCTHEAFRDRLTVAEQWLQAAAEPTPKDVAKALGNGVSANDSCATALYLALRFLPKPFNDLIDFAIRCGGDTDTIASMSGALWGAARGYIDLPQRALDHLEQKIYIEQTSQRLHQRALSSAVTNP